MRAIFGVLLLGGCMGSASARLELANRSAESAAGPHVLADGTSLRLKLVAAYLAEDVDPVTQNNIGSTAMIWLNPECDGDIGSCNVDGFAGSGPRIKSYFDLARPSAEVNADLDSQGLPLEPATYRYARVEMCKSYDRELPTVPTMMWRGPGMPAEQPFTSSDCGRTSLPFDPPLVLGAGDAVTVRLGYDLAASIVSGMPDPTAHCFAIQGISRCFRTCVDTAAGRACMDFPDFAPSAQQL